MLNKRKRPEFEDTHLFGYLMNQAIPWAPDSLHIQSELVQPVDPINPFVNNVINYLGHTPSAQLNRFQQLPLPFSHTPFLAGRYLFGGADDYGTLPNRYEKLSKQRKAEKKEPGTPESIESEEETLSYRDYVHAERLLAHAVDVENRQKALHDERARREALAAASVRPPSPEPSAVSDLQADDSAIAQRILEDEQHKREDQLVKIFGVPEAVEVFDQPTEQYDKLVTGLERPDVKYYEKFLGRKPAKKLLGLLLDTYGNHLTEESRKKINELVHISGVWERSHYARAQRIIARYLPAISEIVKSKGGITTIVGSPQVYSDALHARLEGIEKGNDVYRRMSSWARHRLELAGPIVVNIQKQGQFKRSGMPMGFYEIRGPHLGRGRKEVVIGPFLYKGYYKGFEATGGHFDIQSPDKGYVVRALARLDKNPEKD